jgi:transposase
MKYKHLQETVADMCSRGLVQREISEALDIPIGTVPFLLKRWGLKSGGIPAHTRRWQAIFERHAPVSPMTVNEVRVLLHNRSGIWVGSKWLTERMRERGLLLSRKEAMKKMRCPICGLLVSPYNGNQCARCGYKKGEKDANPATI